MVGLRLEARDFTDLTRWRWVLIDEATGALLANHDVRLDPGDWRFQAFGDLTGYLSWHVAPDRRQEDEAHIVGEVGAWIGSEVLGPISGALARKSPTTVRVIVPEEAGALLFRPLELAHAGGRPLSVQEVTLVMQTGREGGDEVPGGQRLRVLGLFSLPEGGKSLNLRRERHLLVQLIQGIASSGKAADVRVLQYGVTRERLRDTLGEAEGWDIIHVAGHGTPGELLLETAAGKEDRITAAELADLLDAARERVKLVTLAVCWSAAVTIAEQRRQLGLPVPGQSPQDNPQDPAGGESAAGALATELVARLGCAVLAMRYPVVDEFSVALTGELYDLLARRGEPLPRAVGIALRQLLTGSGYPALSAATLALFGARSAALRVTAPAGDQLENCDTSLLKMAGFPPQPERFVGRTGVMARVSSVLAELSGIPGVLLHGMPGGGKTACALELAYNHAHVLDRLVWYKAPDDGMDITGSLTDFALALEQRLPGFQMAHELVSAEALAGFLPTLTHVMERSRFLIVIDNAESLITESGAWRDEEWGKVVGALTAHKGLGRVVLTSRRLPAGLQELPVESVDALSEDEALLLARELPHLSSLSLGKIPGLEPYTARRLAGRALKAARGHPKLLELADAQAAHPDMLAKLVEASHQAWREPSGFFRIGDAASRDSAGIADDYWRVLGTWTHMVGDTLAPGERDLFWFLCCLEERDRERWVLDANWADLWHRLGREGELPDLDRALADVVATSLAAVRTGTNAVIACYVLHPAVAEAGRIRAGKPFGDAVDAQAAAFWYATQRHASEGANDNRVDTELIVRAGLASIPYCLRQRQWDRAAFLLEDSFNCDPSRENAAAVLPAIQQITRQEPRAASVLAEVLTVLNPPVGEAAMRAALDAALSRGDYRFASVAAQRLAYLCLNAGRLTEALELIEQMVDFVRRTGLGPWSQLTAEIQRLQVLNEMGQASQVLKEVGRLRAQMDALSAIPIADSPREATPTWNVREMLLSTGRSAAVQLGEWVKALDLSAAELAIMRDRRAPVTEIASTQFNDYAPLLRLGRTNEALALLLEVRQVFEDAHDTRMLGKVLGALADAEDELGHGDVAIRLELDALRYSHLAGDVSGIASSYHNLGNYLHVRAREPALALVSHITAALIYALTGIGRDSADRASDSVGAAGIDLRELGTAAAPPLDVAELARQVSEMTGISLPDLIPRISLDPQVAEQALRELIGQAKAIAAQQKRRWWQSGRRRSE